MKDDFIAFLKSNNCNYKEIDEPDEEQVRVMFTYQGGNYFALIKNSNIGFEINYPAFFAAPPGDLQLVRAMCNRANSSSLVLKYVYTFDEEENCIRVHLSFFINAIYPEQLKLLLGACFACQRDFIDNYHDAKKTETESDEADVEEAACRTMRERYLIAMQEMRHDATSNGHGWRADANRGITLEQWLDKAMSLRNYQIDSLKVVRGTQVETIDSNLAAYDLSRMLIKGTGKDAILAHQSAVAIARVSLWDSENDDAEQPWRIITITAMADGDDDKSIYFRVTSTMSAATTSRSNTLSTYRLNASTSNIMAYDRVPDEQRQQEFDYMWRDARIKIRDGEQLSDQQQLIYDVTRADIAYNLYWGRSFMLDKRYVQALQHFENAYCDMLPEFFNLPENLRATFMNICYYMGICYCELQQYERAFYYLQLFEGDPRVQTATTLVNCLACAHDIRVFRTIDTIVSEIAEHFKDEDEMPEGIHNFLKLLSRRRAYALINFNKLDDAEQAFKEMLDDPDNGDYALSELAHIARLREQREQAAPDSPSDSTADNSTSDASAS